MSTPPDLFAALREALSSDRIDRYRRHSTDSNLDLLERYFWNMALSEALYPLLQALEVALRNKIYRALSSRFNTPDWLTQQPSALFQSEQDQVTAAVDRIRRTGKQVTAGRIVAELNFGFWTSLFDRRYEQQLWPRLLLPVFPNLARRLRTRRMVSTRMSELRRLRNRVFHHEPIWEWHNLQQLHHDLLEAIGWLDVATAETIQLFDRFPAVYAGGSAPFRRALDQLNQTWPQR